MCAITASRPLGTHLCYRTGFGGSFGSCFPLVTRSAFTVSTDTIIGVHFCPLVNKIHSARGKHGMWQREERNAAIAAAQ